VSLPPPLVADARFPKQSPAGIGVEAIVLKPLAQLPADPEEGMIARLASDGLVYTRRGGVWTTGTGVGSTHVHHQALAAAVWSISHTLGYRPSVHAIDTTGEQIIGEVTFPALNQVQVAFLIPVAGYAYLT